VIYAVAPNTDEEVKMQKFNSRVRVKVLSFLVALVVLGYYGEVQADYDPNIEAQVEAMLAQMTLAEKVGQMTMVVQTKINDINVTTYRIGAILVMVGTNAALAGPQAWADRFDPYQVGALNTPLQIPLLVATDAVHGHNNAWGATIFPHNIGLGATGDPELMYRIGEITALEVAATGCDMTLAPCVAVPRDIRWGRTYEGWGGVPQIHEDLVGQLIRGFQTPYNGLDYIPCTAKHYIGDGGTVWGTGMNGKLDQGDCQLSEADLRAIHLPPYLDALDANCQVIMASYSKYQGVEMHHHYHLLTEVLKNELGFDGFVVSDYGGIYDINDTARASIKSAINAGIDMSMESDGWKTFITELTDLVNDEEVPLSRIDDAVRRILRVKYRARVFDKPLADRTITNNRSFGSKEHRAVAREAVRKSCVLLQNKGDVLPLKRNLNVLVAGTKSDDMRVQCGGWTVTEGPESPPTGRTPLGTTILGGIEHATRYLGTVTYSANGTGGAGKDVAIAVVGEGVYAEWGGDNNNLNVNTADATVVSNVAALSIPKVLVILAGRPIDINTLDVPNDFNAVVMAWLPGTEGDGLGDVLFGDYPFRGTLSQTWMKDEAQLPMHPEDANYDPLFPLGAGLTTIEFDSTSSASDSVSETSTLSWSHTVGSGQDRALVVGLAGEDSNSGDLVVSSVTYNGNSMSPVPGSGSVGGDAMKVGTELYYMLDSNLPAAGTYTVAVTYAGPVNDITAGVVSLFNVKQQPEAVAVGADPNAAEISTEVTTLSDGAWLIDVVGSGEPCALRAAVLQTSRWSSSAQGSSAACSTKVVSAPRTVSMKWNESASTVLSHSAAAFAPRERTHPKGDINGDFVLDWQDIEGFANQWNPGWLPAPADSNLISHWAFDEGSGTVARDSKGVNHGVTDANWTDGIAMSALQFDGNEVVNCGNDRSLNLQGSGMSISLWVKLNPTRAGALVNKGNSVGASDPNGAYTLYYDPAGEGTLTFTLRKNDNVTTGSVTVSPFSAENWTHIAATFKSSDMRLYIDGGHPGVAAFAAPSLYTNSDNLGIGGYADCVQTISGSIEDVRFYNKALAQTEIQDMQPCNFGSSCADADQKNGVNWVDYAQIFDEWNP
jgi:beta-glucosidase